MKNSEQQAFPFYDNTGSISGIGLTKREYFAAMAMHSEPSWPVFDGSQESILEWKKAAASCVRKADFILTQLEESK